MNIEEQNTAIIRARMIERGSTHSRSTSVVNEALLASVMEHRREHGIVSRIRILRQLVETRKWTRTVIA
jgi:hypothetical protein